VHESSLAFGSDSSRPDKVQRRVVDESGIGATENVVLAGVVEVPLKLLRHHFNRNEPGRRIVQVERSPNALAHHCQSDEDNAVMTVQSTSRRLLPCV
jgi:hypothetical protein